MTLNIKPSTSQERSALFTETLLNNTDKISKVSPNSIVSGISNGVAKVAGKAEKDILISIARLFPDSASGDQLDQVAEDYGIAPRFGELGSSTYIRLVADPGTVYPKLTTVITSTNGIQFELEEDVTMGVSGYLYARISSQITGVKTNCGPLTINKILPVPVGHKYLINESYATGGRDVEDDQTLRVRIKDGSNILAKGTIASIEQKFILINNKVLKVFYQGITFENKVRLAIATQTGEDLSPTELEELLEGSHDYFSLTDCRPFGQTFYGVELINITYLPIDISFRADISSAADPDEVRKKILISITKYMDFRFFNPSRQRVEWDNLLQIVKETEGVSYCADQYFYPRADIAIDINVLPRIRGFLMLDLNGNIIQDFSGNLQPVFYPNNVDFNYQETVLNLGI